MAKLFDLMASEKRIARHGKNYDTSTRESLAHLPCQWFWTWLSGCPLAGEEPVFHRTPLMHVADSIGGFFIAVAIGNVAVDAGHLWLLPFVWLVVTGRARKMYVTVEHQVTHSRLFECPSRKLRTLSNRLVGEFIGVVLWVPEVDAYTKTHPGSHHKNRDLATPRDKDGASIFQLGFVPGLTAADYWSLLAWTLANPLFYLREAVKRVRMSLLASSWRRVGLSWLFLISLLSLGWVVEGWWNLLLAYIVPVFVGFPIAGILQMLGRHFWGTHMEKLGTCERTALVCQGRFLLDAYPCEGASLGPYITWWVRLTFYHLPVRIAVLNGDVQQHDWHHRHPGSRDWVESAYARARDIEAGCPGWENSPPYKHTWSLFQSIARTFQEMAAAPALTKNWLAQIRGEQQHSDIA